MTDNVNGPSSDGLYVCVWCGHIKYDMRYGEKVVCCAPDGDGHLYSFKSLDAINKAKKFNSPARKFRGLQRSD